MELVHFRMEGRVDGWDYVQYRVLGRKWVGQLPYGREKGGRMEGGQADDFIMYQRQG